MKREVFENIETQLLRGILATLERIESRLAPRSDLLDAIVAAIGRNVVFGCAELIDRADAELLHVTGTDPVVLGKRLSELARQGLVRREGRDPYGLLWSIM